MELFEILPRRLWQSSSPVNWGEVVELGITVVIDVNGDGDRRLEPTGWFLSESIVYMFWPLSDGRLPQVDMLELITSFAADLLALGRRILVLCSAGVNRSGLLTALIVRLVENVSGAEAVQLVQHRRPGALTNPSFTSYVLSLPPDVHRRPSGHAGPPGWAASDPGAASGFGRGTG